METNEFKKLFERKFGNKRGSQLRGAAALNMRQGNLSAYLRGTGGAVPQKYIDALNATPDYCPPIGITQEIYDGEGVPQLLTFFTTRLTPQAAKDLEFAARYATKQHHMPDLGENEDVTAKFFEMIMHDYVITLMEGNPRAFHKTKDAMERDRQKEIAEFNADTAKLRDLVADELTENEVFDEDPLA